MKRMIAFAAAVLPLALIVWLGTLCLQQKAQIREMRTKMAAAELDEAIDGLRAPYEALLWDTTDFREVAEYRLRKCNDYGSTISHYTAVLQDDPTAFKPHDFTSCWNASFEHYWINRYLRTCEGILSQLKTGQGLVNDAVRQNQQRVIKTLRLHLERALQSKENHITIATCELWLALFEPTPAVHDQLRRLLAAPRYHGGAYSAEAIKAVRLINEYQLKIEYPADMKEAQDDKGPS